MKTGALDLFIHIADTPKVMMMTIQLRVCTEAVENSPMV
jgi:hypothetical protein